MFLLVFTEWLDGCCGMNHDDIIWLGTFLNMFSLEFILTDLTPPSFQPSQVDSGAACV